MTSYMTEDGVEVREGDRAYDYYSMKPGVVSRDNGDGWFDFRHDDGTVTTLNGPRICSIGHAARRGLRGAKEAL